MKQLTIKKRTILVRTGYRKYPYKEVQQFIIEYGKEKKHIGLFDESKVKKPFEVVLSTRKKSELDKFINNLGLTDNEKILRGAIESL